MPVGVGACLLMVVSACGVERAIRAEHVALDPSRIAAQVVSGIGFLGAGSIIARGQTVRGLATAASIRAVAAVGLAAGDRTAAASIRVSRRDIDAETLREAPGIHAVGTVGTRKA